MDQITENPSLPQKDSTPRRESTSRDRHSEIMSGIDKRIGILDEFSKQLDVFTIDNRPQDVEYQLTKFYQGKLSQFPESTQSKVARLKAIANEQLLYEKGTDSTDDEQITKYSNLTDEQDLILSDKDVRFLSCLESVIQNLVGKNRTINTIKGDRSKIDDQIRNTRRYGQFDWSQVAREEWTPFHLALVFNPEYFKSFFSVGEGVKGFHMSGSVINMIKGRNNRHLEDEVIRHEALHNLVDGRIYPRIDPKIIRRRIAKLKGLQKLGLPPPILQNQASLITELPAFIVNSSQEEILASFETIINRNFLSPVDNFIQSIVGKSYISTADHDHKDRFKTFTDLFQTAGHHIRMCVDILEEEIAINKGTPLEDMCRGVLNRLSEKWVDMIEQMQSDVNYAKTLGEEASRAAHLYLFLAQPSEFRHLRSFLEYKYGKKKPSSPKSNPSK